MHLCDGKVLRADWMHASVRRYQAASEVHGGDPRHDGAGLAVAAHPEADSLRGQVAVLRAGMGPNNFQSDPGHQVKAARFVKQQVQGR